MPKSRAEKPKAPKKQIIRITREPLPDVFAEQRGFWIRHWKEAIILLVAAIALYAQTMPYEFVLDDQIVISSNKFTKKGVAGIPEIFKHDSFMGYFGEQKDLVAGSRYRPLSLALFAVVHEFFELDPRAYHVLNILLYALLGLLVFRVLAVLFHRPASEHKWFAAAPFIGAMLYVVHPVHTEVVANVKGCDEILAMLGAMGALYGVLRYVYRRSIPWLLLSGIFFFAGILAKENTITFLAVIPLTLYFFTRARIPTWAIATLPSLVFMGVYVWIREAYTVSLFNTLSGENTVQDLMNNPFLNMTPDQKSATIMYTLGLYAKLLVFPYPLTHDYYPYHIPIMEWARPGSLLSAAAYGVLGLLALFGLIKRHVYAYSILFFLVTVSIVSNVVFPIGTFMNERFLFMPSLAVSVAGGYYGARFVHSDKAWLRWLTAILIVGAVAVFTWRSYVRIPAWRDTLSLNSSAVKVSINSARANSFMGTALFQEAQKIKHADEKLATLRRAEIYIDKALAIMPDYYNANQMKSGVLAEYYRYDRDLDKLLNGFAEILERKPNVEYVQQYCEYLNGRDTDHRKMLDFYYHVGYEIFALRLKRYDYALKYLTYGFQIDPYDAKINLGMGKSYIGYGDPQRSEGHLQRAYTKDPSLRNQ